MKEEKIGIFWILVIEGEVKNLKIKIVLIIDVGIKEVVIGVKEIGRGKVKKKRRR